MFERFTYRGRYNKNQGKSIEKLFESYCKSLVDSLS